MKRLAFFLLISTSVSLAQNVSYLLPAAIGSYKRSDSARIYAGDMLYRLIDGGADIFREYGFDKVMVQRFSDGGSYVDVELYEMKDSASAYGIFSMVSFSTGRRIESPVEAVAGEGFLIFWKGKYYVSLTESAGSVDRGLTGAAEDIARKITAKGKPRLVSMFDNGEFDGRPGYRLAYFKGVIALSNLTKISFGNEITIKEGICLSGDSTTSFVFAYDTEERCLNNYSLLIEYLKSGSWELVRFGRDSAVFRNRDGFLNCLRLRDYVVVTESKDQAGARERSERIESVLAKN